MSRAAASTRVDAPPDGGTAALAVGVRIAGLPTTALDASRIPRSTQLALHIASLDEQLAAEAGRLGDTLHTLIGTEPARPHKARLVGLRRAVHRGARIGPLIDAAAPADVLGVVLTEHLHAHAALHRTRSELLTELERVLPAETRSAAQALGALVRDPSFATGLAYASPDLYEDLLRWGGREASRRRPLDGAAVRLAKYAGRAMAKPSPLTTFAACGLGSWAHSDAGDGGVRLSGTALVQVAEAGLLPLSRIAAALALVPELDDAVHLRVNPSATPAHHSPEGGDQWLFTAPGPSGEVRALPATPALTAILGAVREAGSPRRLRALLGAPGTGSTADAVLARLVRLGLLEVRLGLPDQELSAATLCEWLGRHLPQPPRDDGRLTLLLAQLRAVRDQTDAAGTAAPGSHRRIATALRDHLTSAAQILQLMGPGEQLEPGPLYFHHTAAVGAAAELDPSAWQPALADLALIPALLSPFDTLAPPREALLHLAVTAYGPGFERSFTSFLRDFGAWWAAAAPHTPTARDAGRQDELRRLIAGTPPASDGTLRLDPQAVRDLCATWPDPLNSGDSHVCYVQALPRTNTTTGLGLVLNTVTCGHGTGLTRIARLTAEQAGGAAAHRSPAPHDAPDGPLYAEFDAVFGSALNQRAPATRYAIDLDGATSHRPPEQLIRPADLNVVHDPHTRRLHLVHRTMGRVVRPLHLGLLATPLLPLQARLLVEAFGQTSYTFWSDWPQLWRLLPPGTTTAVAGGDAGRAAGSGWTALPRLAVGAVVVRRATWFIDPGRGPVRAPGERDAAHLVRVHAWRAALGLPRRCFLRVLTPRPADGFTGPALHDKDRKPVYVDFAHPHLLRVFERAVATGRPLLLTEALPDLHDAPAHQDGSRHVSEFVIDMPTLRLPAAPRRGEA
ncbi:lantibiotic dehydratase [Streptomyces sp. NBC_00083]|uniref:lantibiotic dehydratase n=1 Tax=Streptomyces sp. NBC_00083 TaxID=2975647 RepID=UPI00224D0456|nr:lantibiotic dehydratase [Streptomyces sp. NBC_00083]MCX5384500.1 lantibiotic dehydratase family protein [Streptomyces sp. NBC_00083]